MIAVRPNTVAIEKSSISGSLKLSKEIVYPPFMALTARLPNTPNWVNGNIDMMNIFEFVMIGRI